MAAMAELPSAFALHRTPGPQGDARYDEILLELAATQGATACLWEAQRGLVVPRTYRRYDAFETVCDQFAASGWPVTVRQTGGGIVPQGPGIVNLSLAYPVTGAPMRHSESGYRLICRILADALAVLGVDAFPAPVEGSFCDGRYNLAVLRQGEAVKIAGTAQLWRRAPGAEDLHVGLVHALVLVEAETGPLTEMANAFEAALGSGRRYRSDRVISVSELLGESADLRSRYALAVETVLSQMRESAPERA